MIIIGNPFPTFCFIPTVCLHKLVLVGSRYAQNLFEGKAIAMSPLSNPPMHINIPIARPPCPAIGCPVPSIINDYQYCLKKENNS